MRFFIYSISLILVFIPGAIAGNWTPEQQEVLDHLQGCWDAWEKAVAEKNHEIWVEDCRPDPELVWWWDGDGVPQDMDAYRRITKWAIETEARAIYSDFRPIDVKIHGNTAIVSNYGYAGWLDKNGTRLVTQDKRLSVFQKKAGNWTFIAEMVISVKELPDWMERQLQGQ